MTNGGGIVTDEYHKAVYWWLAVMRGSVRDFSKFRIRTSYYFSCCFAQTLLLSSIIIIRNLCIITMCLRRKQFHFYWSHFPSLHCVASLNFPKRIINHYSRFNFNYDDFNFLLVYATLLELSTLFKSFLGYQEQESIWELLCLSETLRTLRVRGRVLLSECVAS